MRIATERLRHDGFEFCFNVVDGLAGREAGAITDSKDMRVDCECLFAKCGIEDDISGLAPDAG
jgi:hypothetical protein